MLGRLFRLPSRVLSKLRSVLGGAPPKAAAAAPPPARPAPRPRPVVEEADEEDSHASGGHDHGHSHGHSHDHGRAEQVAAPAPVAAPAAPAAARGKVSVTPEPTPNPNAMKFTVDRKVAEKGSFSLNSATEAANHPVGKALFALPGVVSIFGVNNFITVTKDDATPWDRLLGPISDALQAHL